LPKPISLIINGRFLTQPATGVQRYAHELVLAFDQLLESGQIDPSRYSIKLVTPPNLKNPPHYKFIELIKVGYFNGNLWEQISLPLYSRHQILFNPCNIGPILGGQQQAITFHDASVFAVPEAYTFLFRLKYKLIIGIMGKMASIIFTDSQFSLNELIHYCSISPEKIIVIYAGVDHILRFSSENTILDRFGLGHRPYILAVGSNSSHKNLGVLQEALKFVEDVNFDVVIAGGNYSNVFRKIGNDYPKSFKQVGYVRDEELRSLYEHATCFFYPSKYEGFGLPPLEAMACGSPVITSNTSALPEICGSAALYCNPEDPFDIAQKIQMVMGNKALQSSLAEKGRMHSSNFKWQKTAEQIWKNLSQTFHLE